MLKKKNFLIGLAVVVFIGVVSVFLLAGNKTKNKESESDDYKAPIVAFMDGFKEKDLNKVLSAYPSFMKMQSKIAQSDIDDLYEAHKKIMNGDVTMSYEIAEAKKLNSQELDGLKTLVIDSSNGEISDISIEEAYFVTVKVKFTLTEASSEGTNEQVESLDKYAYKFEGKWYIS